MGTPIAVFEEEVDMEDMTSNRYVVRRLTPVECERLQGFPDGHTDLTEFDEPSSDTARYRALGNSMAVPNIYWLGKRIQEGLESRGLV